MTELESACDAIFWGAVGRRYAAPFRTITFQNPADGGECVGWLIGASE